jgi:hypothetical protein
MVFAVAVQTKGLGFLLVAVQTKGLGFLLVAAM